MTGRTPDISKRRVLQAGLGAATLFLPAPYAWVWAQSDGATRLLRLPKMALVIGNSSYQSVPKLGNPGNDAKAIGDTLRQSGFSVTTRLDATLEDMAASIRTYVRTLAERKAMGLFYFAGHGLQQDWRNYLVPVDAAVRNAQDIPKTCVDLTSLMEGINKAGNPMNVVILDACRDNPFGTAGGAASGVDGRGLTPVDMPGAKSLYGVAPRRVADGEIRGLSQMDAPHSTLLAYATQPGNVASDGEGVNGLYTENLLREMRVADAKIEDIFKRVRVHVRRRTNGQQIPWESTSLEEDFYFVPPKALTTAADEEAERERQQEMAAREKRRAEEEADRKRRQEQAAREAKLAAEAAERKRQQELAALEQQRLAAEAERKRQQELALKEAQRVVEATERRRREEQVALEAKRVEEEAERTYKQQLMLREKQRADDEAERKRKEQLALHEAKLAEEAAVRKYEQELAAREKQLAQTEVERQRTQKPASVRAPDAALLERQFDEELELWEKLVESKEAGPLEDYLLRYPSGRFSELAQLHLDRVLVRKGEQRIEAISGADNPFTKGSARANTLYKVGDSYTYRSIDTNTHVVDRTYTTTIIEITDTEVIYDRGLVTNLLGNRLRAPDGRRFTDNQENPLEFAVGKRWSSRFNVMPPDGEGWTGRRYRTGGDLKRNTEGGSGRGYPANSAAMRKRGAAGPAPGFGTIELDFRIVARERVTVLAGTFDTFHVQARGWSTGVTGASRFGVRIETSTWLAPAQCRRPVAFEIRRQAGPNNLQSSRDELLAFKQS